MRFFEFIAACGAAVLLSMTTQPVASPFPLR
jgi:hypothetical protein